MAEGMKVEVEVGDRYYYDSETEDGELTTFEAGATVGEDRVWVEGEPIAGCELPAENSRPVPGRRYDCPNPAIAQICWHGGSTTKVCRHHYEKIRSDYERDAND